MGIFNELKKLTRPYNGSEYDDFDDDYADEPAETRVPEQESTPRYTAPAERRNPFADMDSRPVPAPARSGRDKVVKLNTGSSVKVVIVKPERFETAAEIADHLRDGRPVLMNLEQTQKDVARRLLDFLSGVAYALDGKIKKISSNTYIMSPYNIDVMGDLMDELEEQNYGGNGLYM